MGAAAAARLAASFAVASEIPREIAALGITPQAVSPGRACIVADATQPVVGSLNGIL
jgi:D-arginine dehydrogenase